MASDGRVDRRTVAALLTGVATLALLAGAGWATMRSHADAGAGPAPDRRSPHAAMSDAARLDALEARLDRLSVQMERVAAGVEGGGARRRAPSAPAAESAESLAAEHARMREQEAALSRTFAAERTDARWAPAAEAALRRIGTTDAILSIEATPPRSQVVECRRTHCRIHFEFGDRADAEDWTLAYLTSLGGTLPSSQYFVSRGPDGSARVTLYGRR